MRKNATIHYETGMHFNKWNICTPTQGTKSCIISMNGKNLPYNKTNNNEYIKLNFYALFCVL